MRITFITLFLLLVCTVNAQLTSGLVSYYKLDESSGSVVDALGTNTGTNYGATPNQTGQAGTSYSFDATNDYINIPHSASLDITGNQITLSVWVYPNSSQTGDRCIVGKVAVEGAHTAPYFSYLLTSSSTGTYARPRFAISIGGAALTMVANTTTIPNNAWSHIVGTYDGTIMRLYINGSQVLTTNKTGNIGSFTSPVRIGSHGAGGEVWNGKIDEVGIWNTCLTAAQVGELYDFGVAGITYPFEEEEPEPDPIGVLNSFFLLSENFTVPFYRTETGVPISLNETNPHYFTYNGDPTVILTSGEHYGAVLNLDFDYITYLNTLQSAGLNGTRISVGSMVEYQGWFNIDQNTWAPASGRYVCPWARSSTAGYYGGGNKFDLTTWDEAYFTRLKDFVAAAQQRNIIVEVMLFSAVYNDDLWNYSPMKSTNNINGIGNIVRTDLLNLSNSGIINVQNAMVTKIVTELNPYNNVIFEVCNEPYVGGIGTDAWENSIITVIDLTESGLPKKHLISLNVNNYYQNILNPNPAVDVFNFHYARQAKAYIDNLDLNKVIGNNETGYTAQRDSQYRREAYVCLLSGGAYFNNLDYSFTISDETGQAVPAGNPAGGGPTLRYQYTLLKTWFDQFPFISMSPTPSLLGGLTTGVPGYCLSNTDNYAIFIRGVDTQFTVTLSSGNYSYAFMNTKTGVITQGTFSHTGGAKSMTAPSYTEDIALKIIRVT